MSSAYRPIQSPRLERELQHPGYRYREYAPCARLASHVACYWTLDFDARHGSQPHRIIPDGCVDIIVDRRSPSGRKAVFVVGLMTAYEVMRLSQAQSLFGVRMYVESAQLLLRHPVSAFAGQHVFVEDLWGTEGLLMAEEILCADTASRIIAIVERHLDRVLSRNDNPSHALIYAGMKYMYCDQGNLTTADLADKLVFSERHLRRTFDRELGMSPKEMLGIVRFQSMLQELYGGTRASFTDMAVKYGYYDQSHFIKSFKRYYGTLPTRLARSDD